MELDLKIELGRTQMHLEDVLKLHKGSVVPLDKLAGDPVDIFVNGRLIARGEVLVLNDNFCVRVAELITAEAPRRLNPLQHSRSRHGCHEHNQYWRSVWPRCWPPSPSVRAGFQSIDPTTAASSVVPPHTTVMPTTMGLPNRMGSACQVGPQFRDRRRRSNSQRRTPFSWLGGNKTVKVHCLCRRDSEPMKPLCRWRRGQSSSGEASTGGSEALFTTLGSLALVLCLFFAAAYVLRRGTPHALAALPGEVVEILGRAPLPGRHQMHLVRCGHKLLLVAISTAGADTLTEITDPAEVDRLCGLCRQHHPHSATTAFRNVLNQFGGEADTPSMKSRTGRKTRMAGAIEDGDA